MPDPTSLGTFQGLGGYNPAESGGTESGINQFSLLTSNIVGFLTIVGGIMFLIYFTIGALNWITSGGDAAKIDTAKSRMTSSAIGIIIVVAAYAIAYIVGQVLGFDLLDPATEFGKIFPSGGNEVNPLP